MKRILTAIVLIALVGALIFFGKPWMITLLAAIVAGLAAWEFRGFTVAGGCPLPIWWTFGAIAAFFLAVFYQPDDTITVVSTVTLILFAVAAFRTSLERVLWETSAGVLMLIYVAYPLTLIPKIYNEENGIALLLFLFLCVWSGDIAALYIGKRFGKSKLAPHLSPNKTWAGSIASVVASIVFGMAIVLLGDWFSQQGSSFTSLHTSDPWWVFVLLALLLNVAAQFGDLLESALKRGAGIKDSGTLLPGHGGVLDRIDALLMAAPVLWLVIALLHTFSLGNL
ncbi:phosphatidate cytidylyltransferase [Granulicella paludicola]|jgi:phosphatidate cytidylyltransferase|uniref:phosphatidate cytidylyltransferase n=1 Tax=Granulicella paludicola TaxID=474951 RepID=UPI0021E03257|nr:phosphatidate cytidylyltransferase [Granulicella paludicola]